MRSSMGRSGRLQIPGLLAAGLAGWLALAAAPAASAQQAAQDAQTLTGFSVPQYNEQGQMTSQLFGEVAKMLPDGQVDITQLRIEFYEGGTNVAMRVTAPQCTYDREKGAARSDGPVRIARDNMVVTGVGFTFDNTQQRFQILNDSKVVLKGMRQQVQQSSGGKP